MKNLINAVTAENKQRLEDFITSINEVKDLSVLTKKYGYYYDLLPKGKDVSKMSLDSLRAYLIGRKEKSIYKEIERQVKRIQTVMNAGDLISVKVSIEWKRSKMWGYNPTAEAWSSFIDKNGNRNSNYAKSGSIGGCGYDKKSTAVAEVLNQFNEVLKPLYEIKNLDSNINGKNREVLGYGSGYGILPNIEGAVGVECYNPIFNKAGFEFKTVASGSAYDVFEITKLN